jgi:hypothetical protein
MKKFLVIIFSVGILFLLNGQTIAQKKKTASKTSKAKTVSVPNSPNLGGVIDGKFYKNAFFGFKLTIPENWIVQPNDVSKTMEEKGREGLKGKNPNAQKSITAAAQNVNVWLTTSKNFIGATDNAALMFITEKISRAQRVRNGYDYLLGSLKSYQLIQLPPGSMYSEKIESEKFGKETFYYYDFKIPGTNFRHYAIYRKGYALLFTLAYTSEENLKAATAILRAADFAWKEE